MTDRSDRASAVLESLYIQHIAMLQDGYAAALQACGFDALVIHAGTAALQSAFDDQYWPLRPTPAFAHWVPLVKPDATLVIQPGKRPQLFLVQVHDFWESESAPESEHFWHSFDVVRCTQPGPPAGLIQAALAGKRAAFIGAETQRAAAWSLGSEAVNPPALVAALDQTRVRKSAYERHCIAEANRRASVGHERVREAFTSGEHSELELHLLYLRATGQDDADTPYKNIVALNENAAVLHHVVYGRNRRRRNSASLLVDAGARYLGYASDITRTHVKGTSFAADTFAALVRGITELQAEICRRIAPGVAYEALHDQAHVLLAPILRDLGITSASEDELVASGATRCFLPHGLGHALGIQVHDVGCRLTEPRPENRFLRNTTTIAPGQVFTIEPGCYFIGSLLDELRTRPVGASIDWDLVAELARFGGVRIEDNIAVLESGTLNLTRDNGPATP